jgi:organic hydroperoxide reductase OsmC/OhrA
VYAGDSDFGYACAHVTGRRVERATVLASNLDYKLTLPTEPGGGGGDGTNPEQLSATG